MRRSGASPRSLLVWTTLVLALLAAAPIVKAQGGPQPRCMRDAEGELYCARWDRGVAVRNGEGDIVCAPGACVRASDVNPDWSCSSEEGGSATMAPAGPQCDGGCQPPDQDSCTVVDSIDDNN